MGDAVPGPRRYVKPAQAYLLAAGRGQRMGEPKAWRIVEGRPLLARQIEFLTGRFAPQSISVSIQPDWLDRCRALHPDVRWTPVNPNASPLGSLLELLRAKPIAGWSFLYHVDMPVWEPALFESLAGLIPKAEETGAMAIIPRHQGRKGHPVLLSPVIDDLLVALDPAKDRLDAWLRDRTTQPVDVPFACVLKNWNEPKDI